MSKAYEALVGAGLLPREMPRNYTHDKAREVLAALEGRGEAELRAAADAAVKLGVAGAARGGDPRQAPPGRGARSAGRQGQRRRGGGRFAVLVYPEGEVPVRAGDLGAAGSPGARLRYNPAEGRYVLA